MIACCCCASDCLFPQVLEERKKEKMRLARSSRLLVPATAGSLLSRGFKSKNQVAASTVGSSLFPSMFDPFDSFFRHPFMPSSAFPAGFVAKTDVSESDSHFKVSVDLPGLKKEEIKVFVSKNGVLTIEGERKHEEEKNEEKEGGIKMHRVEKSYGKFSRRFELPQGTDPTKIDVSFSDGVLVVNIPKTAQNTPNEHVLEIK
jgi:HSP20 family protein